MAQTTTSGNILLMPTDGSKNSIRAFEWYKENLWQEGDKVLFLIASELPSMQTSKHSSVDFSSHYDQWAAEIHKAEEEARSVLTQFEKGHIPNKDEFKYRLLRDNGTPGEVIVKHAKKEKADYIVMGCRGLGKIRRTLLGSVSDYVVHHADIPVIVVPPSS